MKENKEYTLQLPCVLTPAEFDTMSNDLASTCQEIALKKANAAAAARQAKEAIEELESHRLNLARIVKDRSEDREVTCVDRFDHSEKMVRTIRLDTGETVKTRAMDLHEYQQEMDLYANVAPFRKAEQG